MLESLGLSGERVSDPEEMLSDSSEEAFSENLTFLRTESLIREERKEVSRRFLREDIMNFDCFFTILSSCQIFEL